MLKSIYNFKEKRQEMDGMVDTLKQTDKERANKIFGKVFEVDQRIDEIEKKVDTILEMMRERNERDKVERA